MCNLISVLYNWKGGYANVQISYGPRKGEILLRSIVINKHLHKTKYNPVKIEKRKCNISRNQSHINIEHRYLSIIIKSIMKTIRAQYFVMFLIVTEC